MRAEAVQPTACFFAPFFAILLRWATRLMGMQWRSARSCQREQAQGRRRSGGSDRAENW
jgi:hypothetical protein